MSTRTPLSIARAFIDEVLVKRNARAAESMLTEAFIRHDDKKPLHGKQAFLTNLSRFADTWTDVSVHMTGLEDGGDVLLVLTFSGSADHHGGFVARALVMSLRLQGDLLAEAWTYRGAPVSIGGPSRLPMARRLLDLLSSKDGGEAGRLLADGLVCHDTRGQALDKEALLAAFSGAPAEPGDTAEHGDHVLVALRRPCARPLLVLRFEGDLIAEAWAHG